MASNNVAVMNYVNRNSSAKKRAIALHPLEGSTSRAASRKWTISYRVIPPIAMACDALIIIATSELSALVYEYYRFGQSTSLLRHGGLAALIAALFIALAKTRNLYDPSELLNFKKQARDIAVNWISVFLFVLTIGFVIKTSESFSRGVILLFNALALFGLTSLRVGWRIFLADGLAVRRFAGRNIALITDNKASANSDIFKLLSEHGLQANKRFVLPTYGADEKVQRKVVRDAIASIRGSDVEEIVVSGDLEHWSELQNVLIELRSIPLPIYLLPTGSVTDLFKLPLSNIGETTTIELQRGPRTLTELVIKRLIDVVVASTALVCFLPLLVLTTAAIKLDSGGPVFFRQMRCGFNGRKFKIFKFRTMSVLEDGDTILQATREDKRVTRVGRWLRRTSIDELPQLINVLQGDMSIVGPRPHAVAHDAQFEKLVGTYAYRHHAKPGITGWAQVNGHRGITRTTAQIEQRTALDLWYVENWSLSLDFKIIFMTAIEVFRGENAY